LGEGHRRQEPWCAYFWYFISDPDQLQSILFPSTTYNRTTSYTLKTSTLASLMVRIGFTITNCSKTIPQTKNGQKMRQTTYSLSSKTMIRGGISFMIATTFLTVVRGRWRSDLLYNSVIQCLMTFQDLKDRYYSVCRKLIRNRPWAGDEMSKGLMIQSFQFDKGLRGSPNQIIPNKLPLNNRARDDEKAVHRKPRDSYSRTNRRRRSVIC
jgi:hypothetical protein